eukprot:symbB.v1.2.022279.t1/scaffold1972.1/size94142/2
MASEANQTLTQEVSAQRFRATESFEFLEKTARDQITRLRAERDLEINEARKAIASVDEAKGLEVALLRDQLSRQCQDTENLKQELRRPSELQEEIIAELMSLGAQRGNPRGIDGLRGQWTTKPLHDKVCGQRNQGWDLPVRAEIPSARRRSRFVHLPLGLSHQRLFSLGFFRADIH